VLLGAVVIHVLLLLNWRYGSLRFTAPALNYSTMIVGLLCSWSLVVVVLRLPVRSVGKLLMAPLPSLWAAGCSLFALFATFWVLPVVVDGVDRSFEPIGVYDLGRQRLVAYRTNGGATTSFGIVVRQELPIIPGVMLARRVYAVYPGRDVSISRIAERTFRFESPPYDTDRRSRPDIRTVQLPLIPW
jgi:hypothetical protein